MPLFEANIEYGFACDVCGRGLGYGCEKYGDEKDVCDDCEKAVKAATEQREYLKKLYKK